MASSQEVIFQYLSAGGHVVTVPPGFSNQVKVYLWGAGGGRGTNTAGTTSNPGGGGGYAAGIITANSTNVVQLSIGSFGQSARGGSAGSAGGDGHNPVISLTGGSAGSSSGSGTSGSGGGGGGATSVLINGVPMLVAAGGGGAGGGSGSARGLPGGAGGTATALNSTSRGQSSTNNYATGGGGGAGYLKGGATGLSVASNAGAPTGGQGGQNYANSIVRATTLSNGSGTVPGGVSTALYPDAQRGYAGYDGSAIIVFTKNFRSFIKVGSSWKESNNAWVKVNTAWKQITGAWTKVDGVWKVISTVNSLNPVEVATTPGTPVQINITIAASANNYVLSDQLAGTSYFPGKSIINLTVNSGVIVSSGSSGTSALKINGLRTGDVINLFNKGTIQGRGGTGGRGGAYTVTGSGPNPQLDSKGNPVYSTSKGSTTRTTSIPGGRGVPGGIALECQYQTTLVNTGTIAGGGGGGGGGGGPTGGQGGGGAGYGSGANNGTESSPGAGTGNGGSGGARGTVGGAGTSSSNPGGAGGLAGPALKGIGKITITTAGTIAGPRIV